MERWEQLPTWLLDAWDQATETGGESEPEADAAGDEGSESDEDDEDEE